MIEVRIPFSRREALGHDTLVGALMIQAMRKAGIPVIGSFAMAGVKHGTLTYFTDEHGARTHVIQWRANARDVETKPVVKVSGMPEGSSATLHGQHTQDDDL